MSFRKPFRAPPVKLGPYHVREERRRQVRGAIRLLALGIGAGALIGIASLAIDEVGRQKLASIFRPLAVRIGLLRARLPEEGDYWSGCDAARVAGAAPIYSGEPGYREVMDGDGDGIACEPIR